MDTARMTMRTKEMISRVGERLVLECKCMWRTKGFPPTSSGTVEVIAIL